jgi:hypothetical protein
VDECEIFDGDIIGNIDAESKELSIFMSLENYSEFIFDVLLPFFTDLLKMDFQANNDNCRDERKFVTEIEWLDYKDNKTIPNYMSIDYE